MKAEIYYLRGDNHRNPKEFRSKIRSEKHIPSLKEVKKYYEKVGVVENVDSLKQVYRLCQSQYAPHTSYIRKNKERSMMKGDIIVFQGITAYQVVLDGFKRRPNLDNLGKRLK